MTYKCLKNKCKKYYNSDGYFEICQLVNKYISPNTNRCCGIDEIPRIKEELICKIQKLTKEVDLLNNLEKQIRSQ